MSEINSSSQKVLSSHRSSPLHFLRKTDFSFEFAKVIMFAFACLATSSLSLLLRTFQGGEDFGLQVLARQNYFLTTLSWSGRCSSFMGGNQGWKNLTATKNLAIRLKIK